MDHRCAGRTEPRQSCRVLRILDSGCLSRSLHAVLLQFLKIHCGFDMLGNVGFERKGCLCICEQDGAMANMSGDAERLSEGADDGSAERGRGTKAMGEGERQFSRRRRGNYAER